jgi:hypothetical protein
MIFPRVIVFHPDGIIPPIFFLANRPGFPGNFARSNRHYNLPDSSQVDSRLSSRCSSLSANAEVPNSIIRQLPE